MMMFAAISPAGVLVSTRTGPADHGIGFWSLRHLVSRKCKVMDAKAAPSRQDIGFREDRYAGDLFGISHDTP